MELLCKEVPIPEGLGDAEGVRSFEGAFDGEGPRGVSGGTGRFFLVFEVGSGGNAVVGGFVAGRDGCGIVDVMVVRLLYPELKIYERPFKKKSLPICLEDLC